jgi:putative peptidoglycan lipid II flippase
MVLLYAGANIVSKRKNTINKRKSLDQTSTESQHTTSQEAVALVEATPQSAAGSSSSEQVPNAETIVEDAVVEATEPDEEVKEVEESVADVEEVQEQAQPGERREIVKSASLVMLGNLGSSLLGMARQVVVAGAGAAVSGPFTAALAPSQKFNDFLINGSISGALIPTFNDYAAPEKREELRNIVFTIVNLILLITIISSIAFFFLAPWFFDTFLTSGYTAANKVLTIHYAQIIFFSLIGLGPFAVLLSALYALKEFGWPAFATAAYHLGIIIGVAVGSLIGGHFFGVYGIAFGVLLGVGGEIALLIPGMGNQHFRYKFVLHLTHPALRRILLLYAPIAFSYLVTSALAFFDLHLATNAPCAMWVKGLNCGEADVSAMSFATTLIQFPQGLVGAALSFAVLPTLTAHAREGQMERFKETLLLGFRLGLLLMIPAAAGLITLRTPIISVIFEHHNFLPQQVTLTALALQNYAYQLPFIAIDQLLIAAFYARKNTIIPVAIGVVSVLGYLVVALPFWQTWGMPALALANTVQNASHAVILLVLLRMSIGSLHTRKMLPTVAKILLATALMVGVAWGLLALLEPINLLAHLGFIGQLVVLAVAGGLSAAVYFGGVLVLKVEEVRLLKGAVLAKLGKK